MNHGSVHFPTADHTADRLAESLWGANWKHEDPSTTEPIIAIGCARLNLGSTQEKPWVLEVYVDQFHPARNKVARGIPAQFDGMLVRTISTRGAPRVAIGPPRGRCFDPVQPGCSISVSTASTGTLGCFMTNGTSLFGLTAGHILAPNGSVQLGASVSQSALEYANPGRRQIGTVAHVVPAARTQGTLLRTDIGLFEIAPGMCDWSISTPGIGKPQSAASKRSLGRRPVNKFGQQTGFTTARLNDRELRVAVEFAGGQRHRMSPVLGLNRFEHFGNPTFARPGDSGSLVWDRAKRPIGMIVATNPDLVVITPWRYIAAALEEAKVEARLLC